MHPYHRPRGQRMSGGEDEALLLVSRVDAPPHTFSPSHHFSYHPSTYSTSTRAPPPYDMRLESSSSWDRAENDEWPSQGPMLPHHDSYDGHPDNIYPPEFDNPPPRRNGGWSNGGHNEVRYASGGREWSEPASYGPSPTYVDPNNWVPEQRHWQDKGEGYRNDRRPSRGWQRNGNNGQSSRGGDYWEHSRQGDRYPNDTRRRNDWQDDRQWQPSESWQSGSRTNNQNQRNQGQRRNQQQQQQHRNKGKKNRNNNNNQQKNYNQQQTRDWKQDDGWQRDDWPRGDPDGLNKCVCVMFLRFFIVTDVASDVCSKLATS